MSYRLALIVDSLHVTKPVRQLAEWARDRPGIELVAVLIERPSARRESCTWLGGLLLRTVAALERRLVLRDEGEREHLKPHRIDDLANIRELSKDELRKIADLHLDAIVDCGRGKPENRVLNLSRDGAIAMRYGAEPPGFWEVLEGRPTTGFAVERVTTDDREILNRGSIATELFYTQNWVALEDRSTPYLQRTIERLARGEATAESPQDRAYQTHGTVGLWTMLAYLFRTIGRVARKAWRHAVGREWNFGVAYSFTPWQSTDLRSGQILPKPPGTFIADPFALEEAGKHYIFVEEFPYATRKGIISVFEVNAAGATRLGIALETPHHLSFPFVFRTDGRVLMVPESQGGGTISLYECEEFPLKWTLKKVLMDNVRAADTVLFEHDGRWWMLTTIQGEGRAANCSELHAFFSRDLLGPWQAHPLNPVVMDASKGRNGGFLKDEEGRVHRVAQRGGFRTYGDEFAIYRIDELTPDSYRETLVREVRPDFFPKLSGTHHLHSQSGLTVYDFCRDERP